MQPDRFSTTAHYVGIARAAHQIIDTPKMFDDPIALKLVGINQPSELYSVANWSETKFSRRRRAFLIGRLLFAETALAEAMKRGVRQYVILGAGLDTFAYRNPYSSSTLRVFEVDYPSTQKWKQERLRTEGISVPETLTMVPVDFETQTSKEQLSLAGLSSDEPVFFSWLGVSMYLTYETFVATLKDLVLTMPRGSEIVFDYTIPRSSVKGLFYKAVYALRARDAAAIGEPLKNFFEPGTLPAILKEIGFSHAEDVSADEVSRRFFSGRTDKLGDCKVPNFLNMIRATV